ncbi:MAG: hypothetical protein OXP12_07795 [Thaumarchaeota archaeon]|nr:hypothetical protein [Nitrososphaerota archaeon]MDE0266855.1 hypothetical protein [Nitrososphaerota archaeon]MDE0526693.1 hypothetical protein [Nitrososphaerota archaeon]
MGPGSLAVASERQARLMLSMAKRIGGPIYLRPAPDNPACSISVTDVKPTDGRPYFAVYPDDEQGLVSDWIADVFRTTIPPIAADMIKSVGEYGSPAYVRRNDDILNTSEDIGIHPEVPTDRSFVAVAPGDSLDAVVDRILRISMD